MQVEDIKATVQSRLPATLASKVYVAVYPDEVVIVLHPDIELPQADTPDQQRRSEQALIAQQREATRTQRIKVAKELQRILKLPIAWGMRIGESEMLFTTRSAPVMTRLGRVERDVLDTLVAAGVAETRSSALAYTVRAFALEHGEWLAEVREALEQVRQVRARLKPSRRSGAPVITPFNNSDAADTDAQEEGE